MYSSNSTANEDYNNYAQGGALSFDNAQSRSIVRGSTFKNNKAYAKYDARGSAIYMNYAAVDIVNSLFYNNEARSSIGSQNGASATGVITYNSGPMVYVSNNWQPTTSLLVNNTIVNNLSSSARTNSWLVSGVYYCSHDFGDDKNPEVFAFNNIIYGNKNLNGSQWVTEEYQLQLHCGDPIFRNDYNLIYNLENLKNGPGSNSNNFNFDYSLDVDPGFKDSTLGDFNLSDASLAIGAGIADWSDWDKKAPLSDILGGDRPNPSGSNPDLGAYENALGVSPYPSQVKNVTAFGGSGQITLSWSAVSGSGIKYKVYKHTSAFNIESKYYVGEATETTYTLTGLDNTTRYYLRVTAVNEAGFEGTASSTIDITPKFSGPVYWLATDGLDTNEGSSAKPFKSLEHAIGVISTGDTLMIKEGTYTGSKNREIRIESKSDDYDKYKNVVITSEKGPENTIFDAGGNGRHLFIRTHQNGKIDSTLQIIGLTFQNGEKGGNDMAGASVHLQADIENANVPILFTNQPKFKNCVFKNNEQEDGWGGAIYLQDSAPIFENCVFENNKGEWGGGAIFAWRSKLSADYDTLYIRNSTFKNNVIDNSNSGSDHAVHGGAIYTTGHGPTVIIGSTFESNKALGFGNGWGSFGGALFIEGMWDKDHRNGVHIVNSRFSKNVVDWLGESSTNSHGGAIFAGGPFKMVNSVLDSNIAAFSSNSGGGRGIGGALHIQISTSSNSDFKGQSILINNTIVNNIASASQGDGEGAGIYLNSPQNQDGVWFNNIIYGNKNKTTNSNNNNNAYFYFGALQIAGPPEDFDIVNAYNNIEGALNQQFFSFGNNTFDINPGFISPSNYSLSDASPMIGLGASAFDLSLIHI